MPIMNDLQSIQELLSDKSRIEFINNLFGDLEKTNPNENSVVEFRKITERLNEILKRLEPPKSMVEIGLDFLLSIGYEAHKDCIEEDLFWIDDEEFTKEEFLEFFKQKRMELYDKV